MILDYEWTPREGDFVMDVVDAITGDREDYRESLYAEPVQKQTGWPAIHLYPFYHAHDWSPDNATAFYDQWFSGSLPPGCGCAPHAVRYVSAQPPRFDSPEAMFTWGHSFHSEVSARLNENNSHPPMPLDAARALWSRIAAAGPVAWWRETNEMPSESGQRLLITVAAGPAREWLRVTRPAMESYAARCNATLVTLEHATQGWWGLEKFRVYRYAKQFEQTLFIDADAIIGSDVVDLFDIFDGLDVAMHNDAPHLPSREWIRNERENVLACQNEDASLQYPTCLNSGVVYSSRAAAEIWAPPKLPLPTTHCAEQFLIEHRAWSLSSELIMDWTTFDTQWNAQWWMKDFEQRIASDAIVHAANAPEKLKTLQQLQTRLAA
jgi:hypothetical protein